MVTGWPHLSNPADETFVFILGVSVALLALTTGTMLYFVFRFSRKRHPQAEEVPENLTLEIIWTVLPTLLVLAIFFMGWKGFVYMRTAPPDAMLVKVTAQQWSWLFTYGNGKESSTLKVPVRKPVKLLITSADVLHSLYIPAYRIKEDAVPGRETHLWFLPDETGSYDLFCTEYCGVSHSAMTTKVEVMEQKDYDAWYNAAPAAASQKAGQPKGAELFQVKGCIACHSIDGSPKVGPTLKAIYGHSMTVVTAGKERQVIADETYLRTSLLDPNADVVKGFPAIMPSQKGVLKDEEIEALIEYLKTLR